ncbi:MAG: hypothetical protein AB7V42_16885 [Thermoleophilia bacterium]
MRSVPHGPPGAGPGHRPDGGGATMPPPWSGSSRVRLRGGHGGAGAAGRARRPSISKRNCAAVLRNAVDQVG